MEIQLHQGTTNVALADAVFGAPYNEPLVHQVTMAWLAGARAGTKAQKTKGEVSGGGRKPWKQKGTGRARAGSIRSPLWRGGGRSFAARPRDFSQKVNRKMYRGALRSICSELLRRDLLLVVEKLELAGPRTKLLADQLKQWDAPDVLIVSEEVPRNLFLAARNLPDVAVSDVHGMNPVALLARKKVVMTVGAAREVEGWLS